MDNQDLTACPACASKLLKEDRRGDYLDLTCGTHGRFRLSIDAIIMANGNDEKMSTLRQWLESGRASTYDGVICTYDLWPEL